VRLAVCGRDPDRLAAAVASLQAGGADVTGIRADLSDPDGAFAFVEEAIVALGGLDILVTNAGGPTAGGFDATGIGAYRQAVELNLLSTVAMCQAAVPGLREQAWGRIVAITSISVRQPKPGLILSNTARAGATGFLKTLALELAPDGVTVNTVQPGSHETDRLRDLYGGDLSQASRNVPTGVLGRAEDFGAVVAFLCSDQARFITGASIPVDGGEHRALQ
jgi:3-oxoacyl-[acyl-carrier protein] reductase